MLHPTWNGADHVALQEDGKTDSQLFDNFVFTINYSGARIFSN